ncbi:MAG: family 10 glycosylhydrolase [Bacteroidales bacterium]|nr:family 10 glycosylhydrolase [Bacteroidales bacterium]
MLTFLLMSLMTFACATPVTPDPKPEEETLEILSFCVPDFPTAKVEIVDSANYINVTLPEGSIVGKAAVEFTMTEGAKSRPESGSVIDLGDNPRIILSLPSGTARIYRINAAAAKSSATGFKWVSVDDYLVKGVKTGSEILFQLPYGTDLKHLSFSVPSDNVLSFEPDITAGIDVTSPVKVKFIAENGVTFSEYTFKAELFAKDRGVRGVYLPSPAHTSSFMTYQSLCRSIDLLQELNFNCLFVSAWDKSCTAWPSEVLLANSTYASAEAGNMYAKYSGGSGDAVADMISEAHKRGIKVILWFEYGFMHNVGKVDWEDPVLAKHPEWMGVNSNGGDCNYNNTDYYLNGYDPAVQKFMIDLICESVSRYPELDGIEGDDRLPAMPRNSGYNEVTREAYKADKGAYPPSDYQDAQWVRWRLDNLNAFARSLGKAVRSVRSSCLVCFAPNKYPWCEGVLMQDWPQWVNDGVADMVTVQCYVTANYEKDVDSQLQYFPDRLMFNPAMILKNGAALLPLQLISEELTHNRRSGTGGESQFWFDGLLDKDVRKLFKLYYNYPVEFPF